MQFGSNPVQPQMFGYIYIGISDFSRKQSMLGKYYSFVPIKRQRSKKIIPIEEIEGPVHALLVNENVKDVESAEYVVKNYVNLNTY
jgi:hypothetical protein